MDIKHFHLQHSKYEVRKSNKIIKNKEVKEHRGEINFGITFKPSLHEVMKTVVTPKSPIQSLYFHHLQLAQKLERC